MTLIADCCDVYLCRDRNPACRLAWEPCQVRSVAVLSCALVALVAPSGCSNQGPRVIVRNDSGQQQHLFYCDTDDCTHGIGGNDVVLKPGKSVDDYWNSPDSTGLIGVATHPGDLLVGCLANPSQGQDDPPTTTLLTSQAVACPGQGTNHPKVTIHNPGT